MISIDLNTVLLIVAAIILISGIIYWRFHKLKSLAYSDDLGIYNHREINRHIRNLIKGQAEKSFAFVLIDIDRFKNYNEQFGYDKADEVLQEFVNTTKNFIRKSDTFYRYKNGDEFALVLNNVEIEEAKEIGNRLRRVIEYHPFKVDKKEVNLTISMGITNNFKNDTPEKIRKRAEAALHEAKQSKNTIVLIEG